MNTLFDKPRFAVILILVGAILLFVRQFVPLEQAGSISPWVPFVLSMAAVVLVAYQRRIGRFRLATLGAGVSILIACIALLNLDRDPQGLADRWRRQESKQIASILLAVGERVESLQALSTSIGETTAEFILARGGLEGGDSLGTRLELFRVLGEQADRVAKSGELPPGTAIGIQLFDKRSARTAWAGWPQLLNQSDRALMSGAKELLYSRQVSLYRILTHVIPLRDASGELQFTVVVDMPLEVNYRVNNKFLKSTSLADDIVGGFAANVRFDYYPTPPNLPATIDRQRKALEERAAQIEARSTQSDDSLLTYFRFPAYMEPVGEIGGDESRGLSGRARVRSVLGNQLFNITVFGRPFRYFSEAHIARFRIIANTLILLSAVILFIMGLNFFPARLRGPLGAGKAAYVVGFFVLIRYCLLTFQPGSLTAQSKLLDPAIFATPILGGVMRSAGDLLITAVLFVMALYGVLKVTRETGDPVTGAVTARIGWLFLLKAVFAAGTLAISIEVARRFIRSVVVNANPRLVGETMQLLESQTFVLHLSTFLMLAGIFLAGMICIWGVYRLGEQRGATRASMAAAVVLVLIAIFLADWKIAFVGLLLLLLVVFAPRIIQREDLVSIVMVAFCFVIIESIAAYVFLNDEYQNLRRTFIKEKVTELTHPADNWKVFILEEVLENFSRDNTIRTALTGSATEDVQRLAFDLWAGSSLSLLGYSSAIHVFDDGDSLVSRFTVEMPYRVRLAEATERMETASSQEWVVLDLTTNTPQGIVRYYRGIVNIGNYSTSRDGVSLQTSIGKVVVDIPFFFESLAWSARTGPQTPEVLRNVQEGGIAPRLEEPEALLLARMRGTRVVESSSDVLPAGFSFPPGVIERALALEWPLMETAGPTYRVLIQEDGESGQFLLAGFLVPRPLQHLLRWSTVLSLYFFFTVGIIVLIILLKSIPLVGEALPTLTPGRRLGFQQKLLASFLLVALLPAIILGVFAVRIIKERFVQESRKEALYKSFNAYKSLSGVIVGEMTYLLEHSDIGQLVDGELPRYFLQDPNRMIKIINESGEPVGDTPAAEAWNVVDLLNTIPPEQIFVHWIEGKRYVSVISHPVSFVLEHGVETFYIYYGRLLDGELLGEIADEVSADVNVFNGGQLVASSREGLLSGGFISSMMNSKAFMKVSLMDVDHSLVTETAGRYQYEVAYLPILSADFSENAALGLPLLFRPESYHIEVRKTTSIVFSIFALLSAATIGLGLLLARGIFEPLKGLLEGTKRISRGDLSFKLPAKRRDEIGTVVSAFNEMTDQLHRSQTALEERRRYLEVILVNIGTGVISTDDHDRITSVNSAAERILGIKVDDVLDRTGDELVKDNVVPQFFSLLARGASKETPFVSSEVDLMMGGQVHTVKYMQTRLTSDGRYLGTVYVFEDLTELINSKKLSAWVEMARQIAHEIKNPLTPIKLSTQFMVRAHQEKADDFDTIFQESSETIIQQVEVLRRIATEFSSFGRMQQLDIAPCDIVSRVEDMVTPYRKNDAGVTISFDCPKPKLDALTDTEALRKICTNLIENAMEAMPTGGKLDITCSETKQGDNDMVTISFRDTGPGLSDEVKKKLFEPYFSTKTTGTGLGLAICRSLSREMGGDVIVSNLANGAGVEATLFLKRS